MGQSRFQAEQCQRIQFGHRNEQVLRPRAGVLEGAHPGIQDGRPAAEFFVGQPAGEQNVHPVDPDIATLVDWDEIRFTAQRAVQAYPGPRLVRSVDVGQAVETLLHRHALPGREFQRDR